MSGIGGYARATPEATALVSMGRSLTFEDLDARQRRLAGALAGAGLGEGDRIAVLARNSVESLEVTTGALRAGLIPVPVNPLLTEPEAAYVISDSRSTWLFTDRPTEGLPELDAVVTFGDAYERLLAESDPTDVCDHVRGRPMHYTSGTTGSPKGVWVRPVKARKAAQMSTDFRNYWGLTEDDIHLVCSPLAHSAPHRYAMRTLEAGGTVAIQSRFDPAETLAAIDLFNATTTFMVPTHLERILALGERTVRRHDLSSLRLLIHAGAPIRDETKRKTIEMFPADSVWEFYGSTEGQATRISAAEWLRKPGSVGRPREGAEILITDEMGTVLASGEVGTVWIKDPRIEKFQYWRDRAKTRRTWKAGAFTVGDLGYLDENGYLFLAGRAHDTIITGGVNVYPQEVEGVLAQHPAVAEVVVYGMPNEEWGQEVHAAVVPAGDLDTDELLEWTRSRLAGFKRPRHVEIVAELARTPTGKLKREPPEAPTAAE
ncbi:MAG TPA: AMP-binding protein [Actinomycetota bacterium]|nr:AMP-binding protein [Actinomycetota bacterium]